MQVEPPALCHWWNLRPLSPWKLGRRMEEARTRACDDLFPEVNTHTSLSPSIGWWGSLQRKLAVTQRNTLTK